MKGLIFFLLLTSILFADEVYYRNGDVYKNVIISDTTETYYRLQILPSGITNIKISDVLMLVYKPTDKAQNSLLVKGGNLKSDGSLIINSINNEYDPCMDKQFLKLKGKDSLTTSEMKAYIELSRRCEQSRLNQTSVLNRPKVKEYPNLPWLIVGIGAAAGSYHFFKKSSDYSDAADLAKMLKIDPKEYEDKASANLLLGIGCGALSLITTIVAIQPVEVYADGNSVAMSYKYPLW